MNKTIVAFAGRRFSGKSTASQVLIDRGYQDAKFADPLKNMMRALYATCGVDSETTERKLEGDLKETPCEWLNGQTPRHAMQTLGTEWRDTISTTLWSDMFTKRVEAGVYGDKIVCSDFRFPHEADTLEKLGAYTVKITRPDLEDDEAAKHASETGIESLKTRYELTNDSTLEEFVNHVEALANLFEFVDDNATEEILETYRETQG